MKPLPTKQVQQFLSAPEKIIEQFPILQQKIRGKRLVYLDNAATSQKPRCVLERLSRFYREENANVKRGLHYLSERSTLAFEKAREKIRKFLNAKKSEEIIFVRGATEAINLVAQSYGHSQLKAGDEIIISHMEHHANIVPWQILCQQLGTKLRVIPINQQGELLMDEYEKLLNSKTGLVAITHVSNALGTINPLKEIIHLAHQQNVPVLVDGAQAVPHLEVDVQKLDCDFYVFSGHKLYGPTGIGVLYGKETLLNAMPPWQGGGEMIRRVTFEKTTYNALPHKFEAGTPAIAQAIGLGTAVEYLSNLGLSAIEEFEVELLRYATERIQEIPGIKIIGEAKEKAGILSFVMDDIHAHDLGTILDQQGVAIRAGHHCAMPVMGFYQVSATARASFALYNTMEDVDLLITGILAAKKIFASSTTPRINPGACGATHKPC